MNLQNWCQIDFLSNRTRVLAELRLLWFYVVIWLKKITNIKKKVNLQIWCQIDFLPNRMRVVAEFHCLRFVWYFVKKISPISKKVNLQNWGKIDFLSNKTRVMAELRFLRFCVVIWIKNITNTVEFVLNTPLLVKSRFANVIFQVCLKIPFFENAINTHPG